MISAPIKKFFFAERQTDGNTHRHRSSNSSLDCSRYFSKFRGNGSKFTVVLVKYMIQFDEESKLSPIFIYSYNEYQRTYAPNDYTYSVITIKSPFFRLAQSEMPHENLCDLSFVKAIVNYLCWTIGPSKRAGRILLKLSKNLYCLMPFVNQRTMSWLKPEIDSRPTLKDSPCQDCCDLDSLCKELLQNFSLLAETGYAEGVMCHTLVKVRNLQKGTPPRPSEISEKNWSTYAKPFLTTNL